MASRVQLSPARLGNSANITIVRTDPSPTHCIPTLSSSVNALFPESEQDKGESDTDRYYTASSGDERFDDEDDDLTYEDDDDDDDDDDGMCIMLDSDEEDADAGSLSGLHINLKTLQAVSNMLAHYTPIIQRDANGNPVFVAPPPPDYSPSATPSKTAPTVTPSKSSVPTKDRHDTTISSTGEVSEEFQMALQELENVISAEEDTFLVDKMSELTEVMEKMTYFAGEEIDDV